MKFRKEVPVVGWRKWAILPQFCTTSSFTGMHFFKILHVGYKFEQIWGTVKAGLIN